MAKIRFSALEELAHRKPLEVPKRRRVSEIFGCDVLTIEKMRQYLSIEAFKKLEKVMIEGGTIDRGLADQVAAAMKAWAVEKGATHYTHWFHPLNGATAEKHDGFIDLQKNGSMIEAFDGRMLVQQDPMHRVFRTAVSGILLKPEDIPPGIRDLLLSSTTTPCVYRRYSWLIRAKPWIIKRRC